MFQLADLARIRIGSNVGVLRILSATSGAAWVKKVDGVDFPGLNDDMNFPLTQVHRKEIFHTLGITDPAATASMIVDAFGLSQQQKVNQTPPDIPLAQWPAGVALLGVLGSIPGLANRKSTRRFLESLLDAPPE